MLTGTGTFKLSFRSETGVSSSLRSTLSELVISFGED